MKKIIFTISTLLTLLIMVSKVYAGAECVVKIKAPCCRSSLKLQNSDEVTSLNLCGMGYTGFNEGEETDPSKLSKAMLTWEYGVYYAKHPILGLISFKARSSESTATFQSINNQPPLFPANLVHELFFDVRIDNLNIEMFSTDPLRVQSSSPIIDFNSVGDSFEVQRPVDFFDSSTNELIMSIISGNISTNKFNEGGIKVKKTKAIVEDSEITVTFTISNVLDEEKEVVWHVGSSDSLKIISTGWNNDPRLLGNAHLVNLPSNSFVEVTVKAEKRSLQKITPFEHIFLGAVTLDGSQLTGGDFFQTGCPSSLVNLASFLTDTEENNVRLTWIATETDNAGYRLWRGAINEKDELTNLTVFGEELTKIKIGDISKVKVCSLDLECIKDKLGNVDILEQGKEIKPKGSEREGAHYSYLDTSANHEGWTYYYLLEDLDTNGNRTFHWDFLKKVNEVSHLRENM